MNIIDEKYIGIEIEGTERVFVTTKRVTENEGNYEVNNHRLVLESETFDESQIPVCVPVLVAQTITPLLGE